MTEVSDPELLKQLNEGPGSNVLEMAPQGLKIGDEIDLLRGVSQGLIDPIEGIVQLAEKSTGWELAPDSVRSWAREYRKKAQSTAMGIGGEVVGNIAPALVFPAGTAASLIERGIAGGIAGGVEPVSGGGDYWRTKAGQVAAGAITGGAAPAISGAVGRMAPAISQARGVPGWIRGTLGLGATPLSAIANRLPTGGGPYGAVAGVARGANPTGTPDRVRIGPPTAPADEDEGWKIEKVQ